MRGWLATGLTTAARLLAITCLILLLAPGVLASTPAATPTSGSPAATPAVSAPAAWPLYGQNVADTRTGNGTGIDAGNVNRLQPKWSINVDGPVSGTPVIADGAVYIGSYDGKLRAVSLDTGAVRWVFDTGAKVQEPNLKINLGIPGSAAIDHDTVYVGDAAATVHAINAVSGKELWQTKVDNQKNACIWSSPVPWQGRIYVGVASVSKEPGFRGSVVALDAQTGKIVWQTYMVPNDRDGAGVFAVPVIDPGRGLLFVGTQNAYTANPAPYGHPTSIVALDLATGKIRWAFQAPPGGGKAAPTDDVAFSASPNLFTANIDGKPRDLVGEGQKSGAYWALDRDTGKVVWRAQVAPPGPLGGMEGTSGVSGDTIIVPATDWPEPSARAIGTITALDPTSGAVLWRQQASAPFASPTALTDNVAFQGGIDGQLHAYAITDGDKLWHADLGASVSGGIAVADGYVILGAATPAFAPFVRAGNTVVAFALGVHPATPTQATPVPGKSPPPAPTLPPGVTPKG